MGERFVEEIGELSPMEKLFILRSRQIRFGLACLRIQEGKPVKIECMDTYEGKEIIVALIKLIAEEKARIDISKRYFKLRHWFQYLPIRPGSFLTYQIAVKWFEIGCRWKLFKLRLLSLIFRTKMRYEDWC